MIPANVAGGIRGDIVHIGALQEIGLGLTRRGCRVQNAGLCSDSVGQ